MEWKHFASRYGWDGLGAAGDVDDLAVAVELEPRAHVRAEPAEQLVVVRRAQPVAPQREVLAQPPPLGRARTCAPFSNVASSSLAFSESSPSDALDDSFPDDDASRFFT